MNNRSYTEMKVVNSHGDTIAKYTHDEIQDPQFMEKILDSDVDI